MNQNALMQRKMPTVRILYGLGVLSIKLSVVPQKKNVVTLAISAPMTEVNTRAARSSAYSTTAAAGMSTSMLKKLMLSSVILME